MYATWSQAACESPAWTATARRFAAGRLGLDTGRSQSGAPEAVIVASPGPQ